MTMDGIDFINYNNSCILCESSLGTDVAQDVCDFAMDLGLICRNSLFFSLRPGSEIVALGFTIQPATF